MSSCREVARLIASDELADAAWFNRALIRLHLLMCRHCRGYSAQLRAIGAGARDRSGSNVADSASFEKLQTSVLERCLDASDGTIAEGRAPDPEPPESPIDPL